MYSPAPTRKRLLPWKLLYTGSPQTQTLSRLPSSSAQTTMWGTHIMQPPIHLHSSMHIIHFIIHLHKMGARKLQHPWQWACRQSSEGSNHSWHNSLHSTHFVWLSGHQQFVPWWSSFSCLHKWNLPTSQDFDWPTTSTKPQRWCIDCSTPFWTPPITKGSSTLDWPRNWSYVSIM